MDLLDQLIELMPRFALGTLTLLPFFIAWLFSILLFKRLKKKIQYKNPLLTFFSKVTNISIISLAIITLLGTMGVDISALITGLGLTGFALGFALKDALASCIAGILILFYRPFKLQSKIVVMGVEGVVVDIDLRYTTLKNENEKHLIPNSKLISEKITIIKDE
ncbi:MAG: mechanosensitive ion channel family protein [Rickettsiaceae bacterium]|nr:mechanosensitive ion channel family protein [Rickettsiaceae bacterium]MDP5083050.1 mechanosensitive ion channel family protein [Rickettsiaceae bacterium]